jgi:hypothetical protein
MSLYFGVSMPQSFRNLSIFFLYILVYKEREESYATFTEDIFTWVAQI